MNVTFCDSGQSQSVAFRKFDYVTHCNMSWRLAQIMDERDITHEKMAEMIGCSTSQVTMLLSGERKYHSEWIDKISKALGIPVWQLFADPNVINGGDVDSVSVIGEIQAGVWKEANQFDEEDIFCIPYGVPNLYKNKVYALRVAGDSMNLAYPEGTYIIVVPLLDYASPLVSGKRVIVERKKADGIVEATAKELEVVNGTARLWPRSTNPKFQNPLEINWPHKEPEDIGLETIEISGVIIGSYQSEE